MAIFTLVFEGLICHVGASESPKLRSVLVWSPSNEPEDNHIPLIRLEDGTEEVLEQHDSVTFRNLPTGGAGTDPDFRLRVPTLERLLNPPGGGIKGSVFNGDPDPAVAATVELPFGSLGAPKRHRRRIKFQFHNGDTELRCVPEQVFLSTVTSSSTVDIVITHRLPTGEPIGAPTVLTVDSNSTVVIENLPQVAGGNHFGHFRMLTTAANMASVSNDGSLCSSSEGATLKETADLSPSKSAVAMIAEAIPSRKTTIAQEHARAQAEKGEGKKYEETELDELEIATSNPECTNSGWP